MNQFSRLLCAVLFLFSATQSQAALTITPTSEKAKVHLEWTEAPASGPFFYKIERQGTNGTNDYQHVVTTSYLPGTFDDSTVLNTGSYLYRVAAYGQTAPYLYFDSGWIPGRTSLKAPSYVWTTDVGGNNYSVNWTPVSWADSYRVYMGINGPPTSYIGEVTGTTFSGGYMSPYSGYKSFAVYAKNAAGFSPASPAAYTDGSVTPPLSNAIKPPYMGTRPLYPHPSYGFDPAIGGTTPPASDGPGPKESGDPVNIATADEDYSPRPDLVVYNPNGIPAVFHREYHSARSASIFPHPTGLTGGWTHNYNIQVLKSAVPTGWPALKLAFPNGATESLTPILSIGTPTGQFTCPAGAPYFATGTPGTTPNTWNSITVTHSDRTQWTFTPQANGSLSLATIKNSLGHGISLAWGSQRQLLDVRDFDTNSILLSLIYTAEYELESITDFTGRRVYYTTSTPSGGNLSGRYLSNHSTIVDSAVTKSQAPVLTQYDYSNVGGQGLLNKISRIHPSGVGAATLKLEWNWVSYLGKNGITATVDANLNRTEFTYASGATEVKIKNPNGSTVVTHTRLFDSQLRDAGLKNALNKIWTITYGDGTNPSKPTQITTPTGLTETFSYNTSGNLVSHTNSLGISTSYTYDTVFPLGRLISTQTGSKPPSTITYLEPSGFISSASGPSPTGSGVETTTYTYDSLGNILTTTSPGAYAGQTRTTTFNYTNDGTGYTQSPAVGQVLKITDSAGTTSRFRYDSLGRTIQSFDHLGNLSQTTYNLAGQTLLATDPPASPTSGFNISESVYAYTGGPLLAARTYGPGSNLFQETTYIYGPEGELLSNGGSTPSETRVYDAAYNVVQFKDPLNRITTYTYNSIGQPASIVQPNGATTFYTTFDDDARPTSMTTATGQVINTTYDIRGLVSSVDYVGNPAFNVAYTYDMYGRNTAVTDQSGTKSFTYGDLDQRLSTTTTVPGITPQTISNDYNRDGSLAAINTSIGSQTLAYDSAGRLTSLTNPFNETTTFAFNTNNWLQSISLPNSCSTEYTHDSLGRLTRLTNKLPGGTTASTFTNITYDPASQLLNLNASVPSYPPTSGTQSFTYDSANRLTGETSTRFGGYTHTFGSDNAGNLTTWFGASRSFDVNNRLIATGHAYNAEGDPTTYKGTSLSFGPSGQLLSYGSALSATYSSDGKRAWKDNASGRRYFIYNGITPILELDAAGNPVAFNTFGPTGLLARRENSTTTFYQFDYRGSTVHRLSSTGTVLTSHAYDAYGGMTSSAPTTDLWANFGAQSGYLRDSETNLLLATFRYYDPSTGLWLTRDPVGHAGGSNLYQYVLGNPISSIDPLGTSPWLNWADNLGSFGDKTLGKVANGSALPPFMRGPLGQGIRDAAGMGHGWLTLPRRTSRIGQATGEHGIWGFLLTDAPIAAEWIGMAIGGMRISPGTKLPPIPEVQNVSLFNKLNGASESNVTFFTGNIKRLPGKRIELEHKIAVYVEPANYHGGDKAQAMKQIGMTFYNTKMMEWHHGTDFGRMELVRKKDHKTYHHGGFSFWGQGAMKDR